MEKIKSFTIDHMTLLPGVYVSREDCISPSDAFGKAGDKVVPHGSYKENELYPVTTYDIRITRPNFEPVMSTAEIHAIEHIGATFLRNIPELKYRILYWGPMGCRTGFYLIMTGNDGADYVKQLMRKTFAFIRDFEGDIPGASPSECGNYSDTDLAAAKVRAAKYLEILDK